VLSETNTESNTATTLVITINTSIGTRPADPIVTLHTLLPQTLAKTSVITIALKANISIGMELAQHNVNSLTKKEKNLTFTIVIILANLMSILIPMAPALIPVISPISPESKLAETIVMLSANQPNLLTGMVLALITATFLTLLLDNSVTILVSRTKFSIGMDLVSLKNVISSLTITLFPPKNSAVILVMLPARFMTMEHALMNVI